MRPMRPFGQKNLEKHHETDTCRAKAIVLVVISATALRLYLAHQTITVNTPFSLQDPLGASLCFHAFSRARLVRHSKTASQSTLSETSFRKEDKITVVLMGYKPTRSHNYPQLFKA